MSVSVSVSVSVCVSVCLCLCVCVSVSVCVCCPMVSMDENVPARCERQHSCMSLCPLSLCLLSILPLSACEHVLLFLLIHHLLHTIWWSGQVRWSSKAAARNAIAWGLHELSVPFLLPGLSEEKSRYLSCIVCISLFVCACCMLAVWCRGVWQVLRCWLANLGWCDHRFGIHRTPKMRCW